MGVRFLVEDCRVRLNEQEEAEVQALLYGGGRSNSEMTDARGSGGFIGQRTGATIDYTSSTGTGAKYMHEEYGSQQ